MKLEFAERNLIADMRALPHPCLAGRSTQVAGITRTILLIAAFFTAMATIASAQSPNLGDPLFCQPQEGVAFLIVNGGAGVFTADQDCYNNNTSNDVTLSIATGQGGTMTGTRAGSSINYIYTPPTPTFTGLDTFSIPVTTVWNSAGGTGSAGGSARPGGPATLAITLNVIPSTTTLTVAGVATLVPVPAGSISGCTAGGNPGQGPPPGAILGCVKGIVQGTMAPSHGTLSASGNTIRYTPNVGYGGPDTFRYQAVGINTDGTNALNSGDVTVQVAVFAITTTSPLIGGMLGTAYSQTFAAAGGVTPYTFSLASGSLPPGLSLSGAVLSGTPTAVGVYNFTIQVADSAAHTATQAFTITVAVPAVTGVPTLGTWGMVLLCGLLLLFGTRALARRSA
jgi:hypothetical protein